MTRYEQGWKIVHPDGTTGRGTDREFQWPLPTNGRPVLVKAPGPLLDHQHSCPEAPGDGLCAARPDAVRHVTSGSVALASCVGLLLEWAPDWVLGESDPGKVRLSRVRVRGVFDPLHLIQLGLAKANLLGANLRDANLRDADLLGADLRDANLRDADLLGADLRGANLRGADLLGANLRGANLRGANLLDADLLGADLRGANLLDADLLGANLRGANLRGANLLDADLLGADLRAAYANARTVWPAEVNVAVSGILPSGSFLWEFLANPTTQGVTTE